MKVSTATRPKKKKVAKDMAASYNEVKEYKGEVCTGMAVGRSHTWHYDQGLWKETKVAPERWELSYDVIKRRAGHAPEGSGVPVPVPLKFEYRGKDYEGVGVPVMSSCDDGICQQLDVTLNREHLGVIRRTDSGWKISGVAQGLANAIGNMLEQ